MRTVKLRACVLVAAAGAAFGLFSSTAGAQTTATWINNTSAPWTTNAQWDTGQFPNNNGPNTFIAVLPANAGSYQVTLDQNITLTGLTIDSSDATLDLSNSVMTVESDLVLTNSAILGIGGTGTVTSNGTATLTGAMLYEVDEFISNGRLDFADGALNNDICDSDIRHRGTAGSWSGVQDINFTDGSNFIIEAGASFELQNAARLLRVDTGGALPVFRNEGTLIKNAPGESFFEGGVLQNTGTLDVRDGTLRSDGFEITADTLTGSYAISGGASLQLDGVTVLTNQASVTLDGAGSTFAAFDSVQTNDAAGSISLLNGRDFTTAGDFRNDGAVSVADATTLRVASGSNLLNVTGATLAGGTFDITGTLRADNLSGVTTINADVTLDGDTSVLAGAAGTDVTPNVTNVGNQGSLAFTGGRDNTTTGNFTVAPTGTLTVDAESEFRVAPGFALTNFNNGDFTSGTFIVRGIVQADNLSVDTIGDTDITLDDQGAFLDAGGNDAFGALTNINAGGSLSLANGRSLTLDAGSSLTLTGTGASINVGSGGPNQSTLDIPTNLTAGAGTTVNLGGGRIQGGGTLALDGTTRGSGTLAGTVTTAGKFRPGNSPGLLTIEGTLDIEPAASFVFELAGTAPTFYDRVEISGILTHDGPGDLAGTLMVHVIDGFTPGLGDTFTIMTFGSRTGDFATYEGLSFGSGQFLVIAEAQSLTLMYVPAPGGAVLGALATTLLVRRRRR